MSDVKRQQVRLAILRWMYSHLLDNTRKYVGIEEDDLDGFDWKEVEYEWRRLDGDDYLEGSHLKRITARGLEYIHDADIATVLDGDLRERVLAEFYETDREQGPHAHTGTDALATTMGADAREVEAVLHYLEGCGLIDVTGTLADRFWRARISARGLAKHEAITVGGGWAASTTGPNDGHEFVFGPKEEVEADRLLRDVTEVARSEVLIVDPYARVGIIGKLRHVPKGVKVKVLTSDKMTGQDYEAELATFPQLDVEVRALPQANLGFHNRYIVVDGDDAWDWGHSFHDAGKTKHTVAQLRPVNRSCIVAEFGPLWMVGRVIS